MSYIKIAIVHGQALDVMAPNNVRSLGFMYVFAAFVYLMLGKGMPNNL